MATLPGTAPPWSTMPLPQGWEAKFEQQVGRYFYINHSTKKTQWVDPRKAVYEAQQRSPAPPRQAYIPMQVITKPKCRTCKSNEVDFEGGTCNPCKVMEQQREISLMRAREQMEAEKKRQEQQAKLDKERERRRVQSAQRRQEPKRTPLEETTFNEPTIDKEAVKQEMRHLFANTQASVVDMILETYDFDKDEAKVALKQMGQRIVNQPLAKKPSPKASPKKAAVMSAAQKQKVKANLKKSFPHVNDMMIDMAVDSTNYSEEKSSAILRMLKTSPTKGGAKQGITTGQIEVTFPETSTTNSVTVGQADTSKAVTFPVSFPSASTTTVTSSSTAVASTSDAQKRPTASTVISSPAKKPAAATKSSSPTKKPTVSKSAMPSKKTASAPKKQSHASPVGSKYVAHPPSSYTSSFEGAKGADPNMAQGPDISNLLQDYIQYMGPNPDNLSGANKENITGPVENTGRDSTLTMGPDGANCSGPEPNLAKGSMYASTSYQESTIM